MRACAHKTTASDTVLHYEAFEWDHAHGLCRLGLARYSLGVASEETAWCHGIVEEVRLSWCQVLAVTGHRFRVELILDPRLLHDSDSEENRNNA